MPYMFISAGDSSPYFSSQRRQSAKRNSSPPNTTQRNGSRSPRRASSAGSRLKAVGVWLSTVTRSSRSKSQKVTGFRVISTGTTTTHAPDSSAPHISHTEKSNANEWNSVHTSSGSKPNRERVAENS